MKEQLDRPVRKPYTRPVLGQHDSWHLVTGNGLPSGGKICYKKDGVKVCKMTAKMMDP